MPRSDDGTEIFDQQSDGPDGLSSGDAPTRVVDRDLILEAFRQADEATVTLKAGHGTAADLPVNHFPGYILKGEIHRGGQGVVYKASQPSTGRTVAIKLMHGGGAIGSTGRARFDLEIQVLGRLEHPGIVRVHDSGVTEDGSVYYVMDHIAGQPLDVLVREWRREADRIRGQESGSGSRVSSRTTALGSRVLRERLEMFVKICEGVSAAHIAGVIHRDLKPANIRLDKRGEPVVVDFGLAKMIAEGRDDRNAMTATGQFVGSMPWSSPEQAEGSNRTIDTRADVYSLGVILYQMVTGGKFPYTVVGTARQVMNNIVTAEPKRPSLFDRGINDEVETIVLKAISKEPERRYQSAGEFAGDIRRYLDGEAIEAKRDSTWYVMTKAIRRHRVSAGFLAAILLMGTAFSVALAAKYTETEALRVDAESRALAEGLARQQADAARERAQANFMAVQDLSRAFLFDFHDEIKDLRGAGTARALLVDRAAEYLERLRVQADAEADPEPGLLMDLAAAHDRLASVQAGFAVSNRGNSEAAEMSVAAAERIREGLVERIPDDPRLWLGIAAGAEQRARVEQADGRFEPAIEAVERGIAAGERAGQIGASPEAVAAVRAPLFSLVGDLNQRLARSGEDPEQSIARLEEAAGWYVRAGEAHETAGNGGLERAGLLARRARAMTDTARYQMRAAQGNAGAMGPAAESARLALELAESSVAAYSALRSDDASARDALRGLVATLMEESLAHETLQRIAVATGEAEEDATERAFEAAQSALTSARALAADETDLDAQRLLGVAMNKVGNALRIEGRLDEAELLYEELVAHRRGIVATDPTARHTRDLAIGLVKRAQIDQIRAGGADVETARGLLRSAESGYASAFTLFEELAASGVPMARELGEVNRAIEGVRASLAALDTP